MRVTPADERSSAATARRAQIMAATIETIAELGYGQATFARIAERAKLRSTRLISYHFESKAELIWAVVAEVYAELGEFVGARLAGQPDPRSELAAYINALVEFNAGHRAQMQAVMSIFLGFRADDGDSRTYDADDDRDALGPVQDILRRGQAAGQFRDFDTFVMASAIQRSLDGLPYLLRTKPDLDLAGYARELVALFDRATCSDPLS